MNRVKGTETREARGRLRRVARVGLQIVTDLARQLGGSLEIGPPPKAMFSVVFRGLDPESARA